MNVLSQYNFNKPFTPILSYYLAKSNTFLSYIQERLSGGLVLRQRYLYILDLELVEQPRVSTDEGHPSAQGCRSLGVWGNLIPSASEGVSARVKKWSLGHAFARIFSTPFENFTACETVYCVERYSDVLISRILGLTTICRLQLVAFSSMQAPAQ